MNIQFPEKLRPLFKPNRYKVLYGGRGGAKSWGVARTLLLLGSSRTMRILCTRQVQKSIADSVHQLLKDQIGALGLENFYQVLDTEIRGQNGTEFKFAGLSNQTAASIKSFEGVDVAWVEEAQNVTKKAWDILVPTIRKEGSEIWVTFNPDLDTDETYQRFVLNPPSDSVVIQINYYDNPWFPEVLERERIDMKRRDPNGYANIWEGECKTAVEGAIYAQELDKLVRDGRYTTVSYDPLALVHTVWDLGLADNLRIIFVQRSGSELRLIDHIPGGGVRLDEYVAELTSRKYRYGTDYLPHDGRIRQLGTGKSTSELLTQMGRRVHVLPAQDVEQGIQAAGLILPRLWVDKNKCSEWMNSLKRYRRRINESTGAKGEPVHDDASHDADTLRYLALVADQLSNDTHGQKLEYKTLGLR